MMSCYKMTSLVFIIASLMEANESLKCYECSQTFKLLWEPKDCQSNATAVPFRQCNDEQDFCFVKRVTVKGIVSEISRDCTDDCNYGCEATSFGITKLTCVSCCNESLCNTGNCGPPSVGIPHFWSSFDQSSLPSVFIPVYVIILLAQQISMCITS